ncbi:AbrB/MazE/SpoVT family DNA-binding domain-containing protein, partial [Serratia marcescens]|uniref:AbrB/MazE/SpoVT family DNA-binding domain-containing protein n=1 Tax=Serratia marcescens TaxID=615 RepID=UPI001BD6DE79
QGCAPKTANNTSATGHHPMPPEYDEQLESTDTQLPREYDLYDLMPQATEENLHATGDFASPVGREAL